MLPRRPVSGQMRRLAAIYRKYPAATFARPTKAWPAGDAHIVGATVSTIPVAEERVQGLARTDDSAPALRPPPGRRIGKNVKLHANPALIEAWQDRGEFRDISIVNLEEVNFTPILALAEPLLIEVRRLAESGKVARLTMPGLGTEGFYKSPKTGWPWNPSSSLTAWPARCVGISPRPFMRKTIRDWQQPVTCMAWRGLSERIPNGSFRRASFAVADNSTRP